MPFKSKNEPFPFPNELYPDDWFRRLTPEEIFPGRPEAPVEVDLGCGDGSFLLAMARQYPERQFLGVERLLGRVRKVCRHIGRSELANVRAIRVETSYALSHLLPPGFADRVHLLFPDPWPKRKHQWRRLMCQPAFLGGVHALLKPGGELLFKTDHEGYFAAAVEALAGNSLFERIDWSGDEFFYPVTDFERLWMAEKRLIQGLRLRRVG
ncbi:MAG: tRNA (guanosine(46)-N7)-methyltransferase TrmB [Verrucomicrobiales bacterium]|nr:tRNA (guanosine(46)-N7)-methyltransferase TrmB [Verrucomicrobiales bacterium]